MAKFPDREPIYPDINFKNIIREIPAERSVFRQENPERDLPTGSRSSDKLVGSDLAGLDVSMDPFAPKAAEGPRPGESWADFWSRQTSSAGSDLRTGSDLSLSLGLGSGKLLLKGQRTGETFGEYVQRLLDGAEARKAARTEEALRRLDVLMQGRQVPDPLSQRDEYPKREKPERLISKKIKEEYPYDMHLDPRRDW